MLVFISNYLNHHQFPLAKALYGLTRGQYAFIEMEPMDERLLASGYPIFEKEPYIVKFWESEENKNEASKLINTAECVIYDGIEYFHLIKERIKEKKLTFECGERWLKKGILNMLSPRLIKSQIYYHTFSYNKPLYQLCASAFASGDYKKMLSYKNKCFKWGYFTDFQYINTNKVIEERRKNKKIKFISVGRLIDWKRQDLIISASKILKEKGLNFSVDIYGAGEEEENLNKLIKDKNLINIIKLKGNLPNESLMLKIRESDALLFTSNKKEGWGAVVNEAMSNACPVIGSNEVGSVPFLIKDNENGLIFQSGNFKSLASQMERIITDKELRERLSIEAYNTIKEKWSPEVAASNLLKLIKNIQNNESSFIEEGPCSKA